MSIVTTHVLDTSCGTPAAGVSVGLERLDAEGRFRQVAAAMTDTDGRVRDLQAPGQRLEPGTYRLRFETAAYFARDGREGFYPFVEVTFVVRAEREHYHVPLLLNPFGYSTYRGS